jgi:AbrB family looped-hinge helix DNA binding protein
MAHSENLRKVGDEFVLTIPTDVASRLGLAGGEAVTLSIEHGKLVLDPKRRRPGLEDLIAHCAPQAATDHDDSPGWVAGGPVGRELI